MPTQVDPYATTNAFFNTAGFLGQQRQQDVENSRNKLRDMYLGEQMQRERVVAGQQDQQFSQEQQLETLKRLNMASAEVSQNPNAIGRWGPELEKAGDLGPNWRQMSPQELQEGAKKLYESTSAALKAYSQAGAGGKVKSTQILANGNVGYLTIDGRLIDTGQKAKESFQLSESGGARGVVNLRTQEFTPFSSAEEERAAAAALAADTVAAQEAARTDAIAPRAEEERRVTDRTRAAGATSALAMFEGVDKLIDQAPSGLLDRASVGAARLAGGESKAANAQAKLESITLNAVLDRIKSFGANPTEGERAALMSSLGDISNSKKTRGERKAALEQTLNILRGIEARGKGVAPVSSAAPQAEITATGPNGQKIVLRNGQWVPL